MIYSPSDDSFYRMDNLVVFQTKETFKSAGPLEMNLQFHENQKASGFWDQKKYQNKLS